MAFVKVVKNGNYTVIANHCFQNPNLSNKARGLLCTMLSLPPEWDFTIEGLSRICKDGIDGIRTQLDELEAQGYLVRSRTRNELGQLKDTDYIIYEVPPDYSPKPEKPIQEFPILANPILENPMQANPTELNTYKSITNKENTNSINYQPINKEWWMDDYDECLSHLYGSIDLEYFPESLREVVAEIIGYMADAFCSNLPTQRINGEDIPRKRVITKLMKVSEETIDTVIYDFRNLKEKIKNHRNYIISALYNAASSEHIETESEFSRTHSEEVGK